MKKLYGCVSANGDEIDGKEFTATSLQQLVVILQTHREVHLNYFEDGEDLDLWIKVDD